MQKPQHVPILNKRISINSVLNPAPLSSHVASNACCLPRVQFLSPDRFKSLDRSSWEVDPLFAGRRNPLTEFSYIQKACHGRDANRIADSIAKAQRNKALPKTWLNQNLTSHSIERLATILFRFVTPLKDIEYFQNGILLR